MPPQNPPSPLPPPLDHSSHPKHTIPLPTPGQAAHLPPSSLLCTLPAPPTRAAQPTWMCCFLLGAKEACLRNPLWHQHVPCALGSWLISLSYMPLPGAHHNFLMLSQKISLLFVTPYSSSVACQGEPSLSLLCITAQGPAIFCCG